MTIKEACKLLGVTSEDTNTTLKLKFRKLMMKHHPDSVGSDAPEYIERAQLILEAFSLLRDTLGDETKPIAKEPVWEGNVIEDAFTERTIYMYFKIWEDDDLEFVEVIRGKYEWDPELEEFECLLKSLNFSVMELLEKIEHDNEIYNDYKYSIKEQRLTYQVQLFHLLASQFIPPVASLKKLAKPYQIDKLGRNIYRFQAYLGTQGNGEIYDAMASLNKGDLLSNVSLTENRIIVADAQGTKLGYLSLADDQLYYVIIPILQNHLAKVKFIVRDTIVKRTYVKASVGLYLRMEDMTTEIHNVSEQNNKIQAVLDEYNKHLKRIK